MYIKNRNIIKSICEGMDFEIEGVQYLYIDLEKNQVRIHYRNMVYSIFMADYLDIVIDDENIRIYINDKIFNIWL